jgi:hypothetical protein
VADGRGRDVQLAGGLGEAEVATRRLEGPERIERREISRHEYLRISKSMVENKSFAETPDSPHISNLEVLVGIAEEESSFEKLKEMSR